MSPQVRAVLEMRQHDPAGNLLPGDAYLFGDEVAGQVKSVKTAWETTVGIHAAMKRYEAARGGTKGAQTGRAGVGSVVHSADEEALKPQVHQRLRSATGA